MNILNEKTKVLVTGGNGLVGSAIKSIRSNYQHEFIFLSSAECNLLDWNQTIQYFEQHKPDYVIHLAANVGGLFKNMNHKVDMLESNLLINLHVLRASHLLKVKKLVACLSTCIFPDKTTYPINETMLHNGPPHWSNDAYAYAKRILEIQCKAYRDQYGDNFVCVIPTNIYGPHDNFNLDDAHVIPALIHKCYLAKERGEQFVVAGSGKPLRQFIYSEDLAKLIMFVLEKYSDKESIILSVGENDEVAIKDVAYLIAKNFNYESNLVFDETKADGQYKKTADNTKLINLVGDFNFTNINEGISKSVNWFLENYDNCRK
jgi:GDP-L-fucose synthase